MEELYLESDELMLLDATQAWHYRVIPKMSGNGLLCYTDRVEGLVEIKEELEILTGFPVNVMKISSEMVTKYLNKYYLKENSVQSLMSDRKDADEEDFLESAIAEARRLKSSDIHLEIFEERCRVRIRIDGQMIERYLLKKMEFPAIVNKIKIRAGLDIAEKRMPQDGRIQFDDGQHKFDIRVSTLPTLYGEKVVMRLLSSDTTNISLDTLGLSESDLRFYLQGVSRPNGIVLISGPTGSGKTTTLYATLKMLNKTTRNIMTIEDPIEYTLDGVNQVQLKESIGLTFAAALRTFLRQDPDIIMVGEIRDVDTAAMAVRAALTGHLVLSTIHTNSAWGTISRLIDMGIPPFLLSNTLNMTVAQRLVRLLCEQCKQVEAFDKTHNPNNFGLFQMVEQHYRPIGCEHCYHTGFRGRQAVYEIITIDRALAEKIKRNEYAKESELKKKGVKTLAENAFILFVSGKTTIEEIYPLLYSY